MAKNFYFNKSGLAKVVGRVNAEYLFLAGQNIRSKAKQQLKVGKVANGERIASKAGSSPFVWKSNSPLKSLILYALDPYKNSMVVGNAQIGSSTVPGILNYGGTVEIKVSEYTPSNKRKWGAKHYEGERPLLKRPTKESKYYSYFRSKEAWSRARESASFQRWGRAQNPKTHIERVNISSRPYLTKALQMVCSAGYSAYLYKKAVQRAS